MKNLVAALFLAGTLATSPASASGQPQVFTAYTTGEVSIDAEGRVVDLEVDRKKLDVAVMRDVEAQIRQWRFEPILENGQRVGAKAFMGINLVAVRDPGVDGFRVAFESVHFRDLAARERDEKVSSGLRPPHFPSDGYVHGVGARVNLMLRLDAEGSVSEAAAVNVDLLGDSVGSTPRGYAALFARVSEKAAAEWRIPDYKNGVVTVPVRFQPRGTFGERWIRTHSVPIDVPAWVVAEQSSTEAVALGFGGTESSERWKLITPLDG